MNLISIFFLITPNIYWINKKYNSTQLINFNKKKRNHWIRNKLYNVKNINDCIKILENFNTTDEMFENIINIYNINPPTDYELQIFSILFQQYYYNLDIKGFAASTMWFIIIQWINELKR